MQNFDKSLISRNFSQHAKGYEEHGRLQKRVVMELLNRAGKLDGTVLDIGAGTGLVRKNADFSPVEIDFSPKMCKENNATGGNAICADAEALPFADESFDHAVSSLTIQWLSDLDVFAAELKRVLKSGGSFSLSTFGNGTLDELGKAFAELDGQQHIIRFPNTILLFAVLKKAGFQKLDIHAQTITYRHDNVMDVLNQMKKIGATYALGGGEGGFKGKEYFAKLDAVYRKKFADSDGKLPVTWNVLYISGVKG